MKTLSIVTCCQGSESRLIEQNEPVVKRKADVAYTGLWGWLKTRDMKMQVIRHTQEISFTFHFIYSVKTVFWQTATADNNKNKNDTTAIDVFK